MNKFWKWMEKKGYKGIFDTTICRECQKKWLHSELITDQMLIGYMLEYLYEKGIDVELWIPNNQKDSGGIKKLFEELEDEIKEMA